MTFAHDFVFRRRKPPSDPSMVAVLTTEDGFRQEIPLPGPCAKPNSVPLATAAPFSTSTADFLPSPSPPTPARSMPVLNLEQVDFDLPVEREKVKKKSGRGKKIREGSPVARCENFLP